MSLLGVFHGGHFPGNLGQQWFPSTSLSCCSPWCILPALKPQAVKRHLPFCHFPDWLRNGIFERKPGHRSCTQPSEISSVAQLLGWEKARECRKWLFILYFLEPSPSGCCGCLVSFVFNKILGKPTHFFGYLPSFFFPQLASWQCWELLGLTVFWKEAVRGD